MLIEAGSHLSHPTALLQGKGPRYQFCREWVRARAVLDGLERRRISWYCRESKQGNSDVQLVVWSLHSVSYRGSRQELSNKIIKKMILQCIKLCVFSHIHTVKTQHFTCFGPASGPSSGCSQNHQADYTTGGGGGTRSCLT